ncbi:histidinol-phosphate transaminase [Candidatus Woesearchaeota archaeon]|nr:histidinol-phosphate transaminase [Candidatus Woesearchaeota archaeon]
MKNLKKFLVPWIDEVKPYDTEELIVAWAHPEFKRMMLNENPIAPSKKVTKAILKAAKMGNRYPDNGVKVRAQLAKLHNVEPDNVYIGHGSSEIIDMIMRLFVAPGDEIIIPNPTFSLYGLRAKAVGGKVVKVDMKDDMQYNTDAMIKAVTPKTKVIIVCTPNNPTGDFIPDKDLERIIKLGIPTMVDEAYLEFQPDRKSKDQLIKKHDHVIVAHTLSKAYGMAGIRFGYALADKELIQYFRNMQLPWNVSLTSIAAAEAAIEEKEELMRKAKYNKTSVDYVYSELSKIPGLRPFYSHGNYVLVDGTDTGIVGKEVVDYVFQNAGVMIKYFAPLKGRNGFFRISLGSHKENALCIKYVKKFFKDYKKNTNG